MYTFKSVCMHAYILTVCKHFKHDGWYVHNQVSMYACMYVCMYVCMYPLKPGRNMMAT